MCALRSADVVPAPAFFSISGCFTHTLPLPSSSSSVMAVTSVANMLAGPYAFVLFQVLIIGLQVVLMGFPIGARRKKYFTKEFFEKNFPELKGNVPQGGYPDMGSGKYSQKLSLEQWTDFNNAQRGHQNYVEGVATAMVTFLITGLFQTKVTILCASFYIVGRLLYGAGYAAAGPKGRLVGAILLDLALFGCMLVGFYSAFQAGGGVKGLLELLQQVLKMQLWE